MREEIIALLSKRETISLDMETIFKKLKLGDRGSLQLELNRMVQEGILDFSPKKNKYLLFENSHLSKGRITFDKMGNGIIALADRTIHIFRKNLRGASYNDLVAIDFDTRTNYGVVVRILERDDSYYVGEIIVKKQQLMIKNKKLGIIPIHDNLLALVEGDRVLLRHYNGKCYLERVIGHKDDPGVDLLSILYDHNFQVEFSDEVLAELKDIPVVLSSLEIQKELARGRVDYHLSKIFTIDCDDTKDIDDAVSIRRLADGCVELGVYIADVSHYIKEGSALDQAALERGTSVYLPGSVAPQFPHQISNGICSLNPNVDRLAMCYILKFDDVGRVVDFRVEEGIICSKKKMTYSEVNRILEDNEMVLGYEDFYRELKMMQKLSLLIEKQLLMHGYLEFSTSEGQVLLDENGRTMSLVKRTQRTAEKIIEYFMLSANVELTKYAHYLDLPWIYRIHGLPDQDKLLKAMDILKLNHYVDGHEKKTKYYASDLQKVIRMLDDKDNKEVFNRMLIIAQDKAKYSTENIGHYALGMDFYSHNTSPIRRGPDLRNQRILKSYLHGEMEKVNLDVDDLIS